MTYSKEDPIVLVLGADDRFAMPLATTVYSALANLPAGHSVLLYVFDGGISKASKRRLRRVLGNERVVNLEWIAPDARPLEGLTLVGGQTSMATYFRLLIPDAIPSHIHKALYLDSDIIIESNIARLWQQDVDGHAVLAVRDLGIPYLSSPSGIAKHRELGLAPKMPYFNAGVLLMNLQKWRAEDLSRKVIRYLHTYAKDRNHNDQEGLNAVLAGAWGWLDPRWNQVTAVYDTANEEIAACDEEKDAAPGAMINDPFVIHYTGGRKPWRSNCVHPARSRFVYYLRESGWFSPSEMAMWQASLFLRRALRLGLEKSRPLRQKLGLRRVRTHPAF